MQIDCCCPSCRKVFRVSRDYAGRKVRCLSCSQIFQVPHPNVAVGEASSPGDGLLDLSILPLSQTLGSTHPAPPSASPSLAGSQLAWIIGACVGTGVLVAILLVVIVVSTLSRSATSPMVVQVAPPINPAAVEVSPPPSPVPNAAPQPDAAPTPAPEPSPAPAAGRPSFADWLQDFEEAKGRAAAEGKDILVAFDGSDWCGWSIRLAEEVFFQREFRDQIDGKFVLVLIDFPQRVENQRNIQDPVRNQRLAEHFNVQGYPTLVLTDAEGRPYAFDGYIEGGAPAFLRQMEQHRAVREERDRALSLIESADGEQKVLAVEHALKLLLDQNVLSYYGNSLKDWTQIVVEHDPKNHRGIFETVFYFRWLVYFGKLQEGNEAQVKFLTNALDNFKSQCSFQNADRGAQLHLLAGLSWLTAGDQHRTNASQCFQQGIQCGPKNEQLNLRLQALSRVDQPQLAGTGFVVSSDGYILTNHHVIAGARSVAVRLQQMDKPVEAAARVVAQDPSLDMALLKIETPPGVRLRQAALTTSEVRRGEEVAAFGYPMGNSDMILTRGGVSGLTGNNQLVLDCLVNPGNSGGPLCNLYGKVVGMVTAKSVNTRTVDSYGLAIRADELREFLANNLPEGITQSRTRAQRSQSWAAVSDAVGPSVVMILAKS